jgi:hypothetical protein
LLSGFLSHCAQHMFVATPHACRRELRWHRHPELHPSDRHPVRPSVQPPPPPRRPAPPPAPCLPPPRRPAPPSAPHPLRHRRALQVQRPCRDVISVRCGADQQPAAGQPRQEQAADIRRQRQSRREATRTEGPVAHLARLRRPAEGDRCAAEMVAQQPAERPAAAQGHALAVGLFRGC